MEGMFWVFQLGDHAAGGPEAAHAGQRLGPDTAQLF